MNNLTVKIKETNETLTITREDVTGYFPNEQDGTYLNLKANVITGTKLGEMFEKWKLEAFGVEKRNVVVDAGIGLRISDSGNVFRFFGYSVDNNKVSNMAGFEGEVTRDDKCFDVGIVGDLLGLVA